MIIKPERIQDALTKTDVMDALLEKADRLADAIITEGSVARDVDRKAIATNARKFVTLKTTVDNHRKENVKEKKAALKVYDDAGKRCRDHLDKLRDKVRKPLDEWENAQQEAENKIGGLMNLGRAYPDEQVATLKGRLAEAEAFDIFEIPADLMDRASIAQDDTVATLKQNIVDAIKRDADAKELADLRAEKEAKRLADEAKTALAEAKTEVDAGHVDIRKKATDLKNINKSNIIEDLSNAVSDLGDDPTEPTKERLECGLDDDDISLNDLEDLCRDLYQELMGTPESKWSLYTQRMKDAGMIQ